MADNGSETGGSKAPAPNVGVKKGLPKKSLMAAEVNAKKLWDIAKFGEVPLDAYATALGHAKASGGGWNRHRALVRAFGLVNEKNGRIGLSPLGKDVVQDADHEKRRAARHKAVMNVRPYKDLVAGYNGAELPTKEHIASTLQFDFGKSPDAAAEAAEAFVESLRHAGFLDANNVVRAAGAGSSPPAEPGELVEVTSQGDDDSETQDDLDDDIETTGVEGSGVDESGDGEEHSSRGRGLGSPSKELDSAVPVSLTLTLDLSRFRSDEVIQILRALGLTRERV